MVGSQLLWILLLVVVLLVLVVFPVAGLARLGWRIVRNDEQMEPGGSLGRQMFGRRTRPRS